MKITKIREKREPVDLAAFDLSQFPEYVEAEEQLADITAKARKLRRQEAELVEEVARLNATNNHDPGADLDRALALARAEEMTPESRQRLEDARQRLAKVRADLHLLDRGREQAQFAVERVRGKISRAVIEDISPTHGAAVAEVLRALVHAADAIAAELRIRQQIEGRGIVNMLRAPELPGDLLATLDRAAYDNAIDRALRAAVDAGQLSEADAATLGVGSAAEQQDAEAARRKEREADAQWRAERQQRADEAAARRARRRRGELEGAQVG